MTFSSEQKAPGGEERVRREREGEKKKRRKIEKKEQRSEIDMKG